MYSLWLGVHCTIEDLVEMYLDKSAINQRRQNTGY
jgi:hypothetical protein